MDSDGKEDLLSGSWPGEVYWFQRMPDNTFAAGKEVKDTEHNSVNVGFTAEHTEFILGFNPSNEVIAFERESGGSFYSLLLSGSWSSDSRDSRLLPTSPGRNP